MKPYEVRVTAVTRLAGIPLSGVRLEFPGINPHLGRGSAQNAEEDGLVDSFTSQEKEMLLRIVYANEEERLKPSQKPLRVIPSV